MSDTHWTWDAVERCDKGQMQKRWYGRWLLAEDEQGDLCVPSLRRVNGAPYWRGWFDARKPWHWPSWLLSRSLRALVMVEKP